MENFDDLSNDQLRLKMLEFGMPNMPITATTRKLVVKKLKNFVENSNSKTRRDTIHVTKFSSDEDTDTAEEPQKKTQKKESSRRATIGGSAAKLSKTLPVMPDLPPPKPSVAKNDNKSDATSKRRSGRLTPVLNKDDASKAAAPKEPIIIENSEDEDEMPLSQVVKRRERNSVSPSLSRAEMVSTSYVHQVEISAKPPILEEMEIDLTESTDDVVMEPQPEPEPIPERRPRPQLTPTRESRYSTNITSSSNNNTRATIGGGFSVSKPTSRQNDQLSSSFGRPSLATTYTPRDTKREEVNLEPTDSPYLSEFTKRLSRLKAENAQLNAVRDHPIRRTIASSYTSTRAADGDYVSSRLAAARGQRQEGPNRKDSEIRAHLRQVILALDQKYPIKKMFYLLVIAMIVIFLFVFFFL